ncbi:hypothetical protein BaRGS_00026920 [Batillaria attramentaria]|uniref:Uncharacterized protein n=1 Tax=Batillaria attramentaria TaxID=370345 RepID=A0ABD0K3R0_9CAEN
MTTITNRTVSLLVETTVKAFGWFYCFSETARLFIHGRKGRSWARKRLARTEDRLSGWSIQKARVTGAFSCSSWQNQCGRADDEGVK